MNKVWGWRHLEFLEQNAHLYNDGDLTQELNMKFDTRFTKSAVRKMRQRLGLKKEGYRSFSQLVKKK